MAWTFYKIVCGGATAQLHCFSALLSAASYQKREGPHRTTVRLLAI